MKALIALTLALCPLLHAKEGAVECGNLIYAGTKTSKCFSDEFLSTVQQKTSIATERRFNCYYAEFFPIAPEKLRSHDHPGVEFIYVIQGTLSVHINGEEHRLEAGDAIYFDATIPHTYRRSAGRLCHAIVVTAT